MINDLLVATKETLIMTFISLIIDYIISIPLAVITVETSNKGLYPNRIINKIMEGIIAIGRSIPFVILMVITLPFTRWLVGTGIGVKAVIVPLTICSIPFTIRIIETSLKEIDISLIEAAADLGANKINIITRVKLPMIKAQIVEGIGIVAISIVGYTTMAGTMGGGGLGNYAIVYGLQRYNWLAVFYATIIILVIVAIIQITCNFISKKIRRKRR